MVKPQSFEDQFPHITAAMEAAKSVRPVNELQQQVAADITRFAFDMEVRRAFPKIAETESE